MNCLHFYKKSAIRKVLLGHSVNLGKFSEFFLDANLRDGEWGIHWTVFGSPHQNKIFETAFEGKIWSEFGSPADVLSRPVFNANVRHWLAPSEDCDDLVWAWLRHQGKREPWQKLCKCCASQVNKGNRRIVKRSFQFNPFQILSQMTLTNILFWP